MREPLVASVVLHVALIALIVLGLPPSDRKLDIPASIPIEIVDIGDVTEAARVDKGEPKPEAPKTPVPESKPAPPAPPPPEPAAETPPPPPPPPPPPKAPEPPKVAQLPPPPREPEPPKREPPPPPPDPTPAPVPKPPLPRPEPPKPEPPKPEPPKPEPPKPEPPKPEPPKPEPPKPEPHKPEPPKPQPSKPEPPKPDQAKKPPEKAPEKADPLANLLKDVAKLKPTDQKSDGKAQPSQQQTAAAPSAPAGAAKATQGPDRAFKPSGKAIDAIRGQVSKNWNFDPGRKDSGNMVVRLRIDVALDGTVIKADFEPETRARMGSDTHFRSAAEAALRAVLRTQKLDLLQSEFTPDTYEKWRTIVFTFDPRDMF